jgi:hypothetical protein
VSALCPHCGEPIDFALGSPAGKKGWSHSSGESSHSAEPSDRRSGSEHRLSQKIVKAQNKDREDLGGPVAAYVLMNTWELPYSDRRAG